MANDHRPVVHLVAHILNEHGDHTGETKEVLLYPSDFDELDGGNYPLELDLFLDSLSDTLNGDFTVSLSSQ